MEALADAGVATPPADLGKPGESRPHAEPFGQSESLVHAGPGALASGLVVPASVGLPESGQTHAPSMQADILEVLARLPEFAHARVDRTGELGVRDGGRIRGEYRLTVDDVLAGRTFPDAVCRCSSTCTADPPRST